MNRWTRWLPLLLLPLLTLSCAKKPLQAESLLDTPTTHVDQGLRLLDRGELAAAETEIARAMALDPRFFRAKGALALLRSAQGRNEEALALSEDMIDLADNRGETWLVRGRVLTRAQPENWRKEADKAFERAAAAGAPAEQVAYWTGMARMADADFSGAVADFGQAVAARGDWSAAADRQLEVCNKILRARPGSRVSSKIALEPAIDRADLAVLLVEELKLPEVMAKRRPRVDQPRYSAPGAVEAGVQRQSPPDVQQHWAKTWIEDVLAANGMATGPGGAFHPEEALTKGEFAMTLVEILIAVSGDESLATKHFGETSLFPDVPSSHPMYNAAALAVGRGFMSADLATGRFGLQDPIGGADALLAIRQFQNVLRQSF